MKKLGVALLFALAIAAGVFALRASRGERGASTENAGVVADGAEVSSVPDSREAAAVQQIQTQRVARRKIPYVLDMKFEIPVGRAADVYAALKPRADAGDHRSAIVLYEKMEACRRVINAGSVETTRPEDCTGLTEEQFQTSVDLVEKAAAAGSVEAQLVYATAPHERFTGPLSEALRNTDRIVEYKKNTFRYLSNAASLGSADAMANLAILYGRGGLGGRDPVKAYAYMYASEKVSPSSTAVLQRYAAGLSVDQLQQGRRQGDEIYRSCCGK